MYKFDTKYLENLKKLKSGSRERSRSPIRSRRERSRSRSPVRSRRERSRSRSPYRSRRERSRSPYRSRRERSRSRSRSPVRSHRGRFQSPNRSHRERSRSPIKMSVSEKLSGIIRIKKNGQLIETTELYENNLYQHRGNLIKLKNKLKDKLKNKSIEDLDMYKIELTLNNILSNRMCSFIVIEDLIGRLTKKFEDIEKEESIKNMTNDIFKQIVDENNSNTQGESFIPIDNNAVVPNNNNGNRYFEIDNLPLIDTSFLNDDSLCLEDKKNKLMKIIRETDNGDIRKHCFNLLKDLNF